LRLQLEERLTGSDIGPLTAHAELGGGALRPSFDIQLEAPADLRLRGGLVFATVQPQFDIKADWERIAWPLQDAPGVVAESGQATLRGKLDDYHLRLDSEPSTEDLPATQMAVKAHGDLHRRNQETLSLRLGAGLTQITGGLRWDAGLHGQLELLAEALNPGLLLADWPGDVDARINLAIDRQAGSESFALNAEIVELDGSLRGYPLRAGGAINWMNGQLDVRALRILSGANRIDLDGRVDFDGRPGRAADLSLVIAAPDLASFYPGLRGRLDGTGRIGGTLMRPMLVANLSGSELGYQDTIAQSLAVDLDLGGEDGRATVRLADLDVAGHALSSVAADLSGSQLAQRLRLQLNGRELSVDLNAAGGLSDQLWRGMVQRLSLKQAMLGEWRVATRGSDRPAGWHGAGAERSVVFAPGSLAPVRCR